MPDLPTVSEAFEADIGPFIAAIHDARDAMLEAAAAAKTLQETIDSLHGKTVDIDVAMGKLGDAGSIVPAQMFYDAAAGAEALAHDAQDASQQVVVLQKASEDSGAAAVAAASSFRIWGTGIRLTGTAIHWLIAGSAEFLAVAIPAFVAAGSAALVMAQGVDDARTHLTAMYDAQEATANIFHTTIGDMLGMGHALQAAQDAADPKVFELLGAGINSAKAAAGGFIQEGTQVVNVLDNFAAKVTADLQGAMGQQLHDLLGGGVKDLTEFGQVAGNVGHTILNLADAMPGLARVLLAVVDGVSKVAEVFSSMPAGIITGYMALEEFNRWGSLVVGGMGRMGIAADALEGSFFTFGSRTIGIMSNLAKAVPMAFAAITSNVGSAMTLWGRLGGEVEEGDGAFTRMGAAVGNAGMAVRGFGADMTDAVAAIPVWQAALAAVAIGGYAFLAVKAVEAGNALDKWATDAEGAVQAASNLKVIPVIAEQMASASGHLATAQQGLNQSLTDTGHISAGVESRYTGLTIAQERANAQVQQAKTVQDSLSQSMTNVLAGAGHLERFYNTSFVGALALADAAGVKLAQGITGTGEAATVNRLKIANYVAGMSAMGEQAGAVGHDVTLLGIDSAEAGTHIQQLNQAFSDFVTNMAGGTTDLTSFNQSLTNLGKGSNQITTILGKSGSVTLSVKDFAQDLTRFTGQGAQAWQNFNGVLTGSASQLVQWFNTAGSEGAVKGPQFTKAMLDMASSFTPLAAKSQTAQHMLVGFFQAAGLNVKNFADLKSQIDKAGASGKDLGKIVQDVTGNMANMNAIAKALGSSVGSDVVAAMNQARLAASQLGQNAQNLASAWDHEHAVNQGVISAFNQTYQSLMDVYHNTGQARSAIDALAQQMGLTKGQIATLNGTLGQLGGSLNSSAGDANNLRGALASLPRLVNISVVTSYTSEGSPGLGGTGFRAVPQHASGTDAAAAGLALVGEQGRELVMFGGGERVLSNTDTERFLNSPATFAGGGGGAGGGYNGTINLTHTTHVHATVDQSVLFDAMKTETARYAVRNGNPQQGRLAPGSLASR